MQDTLSAAPVQPSQQHYKLNGFSAEQELAFSQTLRLLEVCWQAAAPTSEGSLPRLPYTERLQLLHSLPITLCAAPPSSTHYDAPDVVAEVITKNGETQLLIYPDFMNLRLLAQASTLDHEMVHVEQRLPNPDSRAASASRELARTYQSIATREIEAWTRQQEQIAPMARLLLLDQPALLDEFSMDAAQVSRDAQVLIAECRERALQYSTWKLTNDLSVALDAAAPCAALPESNTLREAGCTLKQQLTPHPWNAQQIERLCATLRIIVRGLERDNGSAGWNLHDLANATSEAIHKLSDEQLYVQLVVDGKAVEEGVPSVK